MSLRIKAGRHARRPGQLVRLVCLSDHLKTPDMTTLGHICQNLSHEPDRLRDRNVLRIDYFQ